MFDGIPDNAPVSGGQDTDAISAAHRAQCNDLQVAGAGVVNRILRDDLDDSRHRRLLLRLDNGLTLLVAPDIDLAPGSPGAGIALAGE